MTISVAQDLTRRASSASFMFLSSHCRTTCRNRPRSDSDLHACRQWVGVKPPVKYYTRSRMSASRTGRSTPLPFVFSQCELNQLCPAFSSTEPVTRLNPNWSPNWIKRSSRVSHWEKRSTGRVKVLRQSEQTSSQLQAAFVYTYWYIYCKHKSRRDDFLDLSKIKSAFSVYLL